MKKVLLPILSLLLVSASCLATSVTLTFNLDAGILADRNGVAIPDGSLVLLLASPTGSGFATTVNEGSYVSGDAIIVADFPLATVNDPGEAVIRLADYSVESGYSLAIRWFPGVTDVQYKDTLFSPTAGLYYGTYAGATTGTPDGGDPWIASSNGIMILNFFTTAIPSGTQAPAKGQATSRVQAVPEPSSVLLLTAGAALLAGAMRRRRKAA